MSHSEDSHPNRTVGRKSWLETVMNEPLDPLSILHPSGATPADAGKTTNAEEDGDNVSDFYHPIPFVHLIDRPASSDVKIPSENPWRPEILLARHPVPERWPKTMPMGERENGAFGSPKPCSCSFR